MERWPKIIIFDFHSTLSLASGSHGKNDLYNDLAGVKSGKQKYYNISDLKSKLRPFKLSSVPPIDWYRTMINSKIDPLEMVPNLDELVRFVKYIKRSSPISHFGIASNAEQESFMVDMMRYCFELRGEVSPFKSSTVVGSELFRNYTSLQKPGKLKHIMIIIKNLMKIDGSGINEDTKNSDIVLIDDEKANIDLVKSEGVCGILISDYFTIKDWNNNECSYTKIPM